MVARYRYRADASASPRAHRAVRSGVGISPVSQGAFRASARVSPPGRWTLVHRPGGHSWVDIVLPTSSLCPYFWVPPRYEFRGRGVVFPGGGLPGSMVLRVGPGSGGAPSGPEDSGPWDSRPQGVPSTLCRTVPLVGVKPSCGAPEYREHVRQKLLRKKI